MVADQIADDLGLDADTLVIHDSDGVPAHPENSHLNLGTYEYLGRPNGYKDGKFDYVEGAGPMGAIFYEPIGCVNDNRLLDAYRWEQKRAQLASESESIQEQADTLRAYVEARGLPVPDVSTWYYVYATGEAVSELEDEYPEFSSYSKNSNEETEDGESLKHLRFTENELEDVERVVAREPVETGDPMTTKEVHENEF